MTTQNTNPTDLINEIENLHKNFNKVLLQFSEDEINIVPFEGSWTAGQVTEHIIKSNKGILEQLLNSNTKSANRPFDEQLKVVQEVFRSEEKMKSAPHLVPTELSHNLDNLRITLKKQKEQRIETIKEKDLGELIAALEFPPSSDGLTRYEWLNLIIEHGNRHQKQIENIYKELK